MHMRGPSDTALSHGGRQLSDMSRLELIDVSVEDDSLLPSTISPPEDKSLNCVLRLSPSVKSVKKTPGGRHIPFSAACEDADNKISFSTPKAKSEENASPSNTSLCSLDANAPSGPRLTKSEARTNTFKIFRHLTGKMAKSEEKPSTKAVLIPARAKAVSWKESKSGDGQQAKEAGQLQEKQDDCQSKQLNQEPPHVGSQSAEPPTSEKPARRTRSARAMHSLRKSLAWDKAFSTEEGILDGDELPLVTKTPKKLPDLPPLDLPDILALVSPAVKPSPITIVEAPKIVPCELSTAGMPISGNPEHRPDNSRLGAINGTEPAPEPGKTEVLSNSGKGNSPISHGPRHLASQRSSSTITSPIKALSAIPRPLPVLQVIEDAVEKGTKLRLPNSLVQMHNKLEKSSEEPVKHEVNGKSQKDFEIVSKHRKDSEHSVHVKPPKDLQTLTRCRSTSSLIKPPSTTTSISKKVSSVSKKVKDTLGRVLPGSIGGRSSASRKATAEAAHADRIRPATSTTQSSYTGPKVPGSPGPSYLTRSKSARAAVNGVTTEAIVQKTGVLAESNKGSSSNVSVKLTPGQKKPKGESIWGSIRGRGGTSSTKGNENVPLHTAIPSPSFVKKMGGVDYDGENSNLHDLEDSHTDVSRGPSSLISKPSGLRMPSPKIGFFDAGRSIGAHEKQTVSATDVTAKHGLPPRPPSQHGSTSARFAQAATVDPLVAAVRGYLISGIPVAPHVTRASGKGGRKGLIPSASAPASPRKNSEMLSPGTHQAVTGRYLTSRSNFTHVNIQASPEPRTGPSLAARKLTLEHSDGKLQKISTEVEEDALEQTSLGTSGCKKEVQSAEDTHRTGCSSQPAEAIVGSTIGIGITDPTEVSPKQPSEEKRTGINVEISSGAITILEQSPIPDSEVTAAYSGNWTDRVLSENSSVESKECLGHLMQSLHNSPTIQGTFWNQHASNAPPVEDLCFNNTQVPSNANGPSSELKDGAHSEDARRVGGSESGPEIPDEVIVNEHEERASPQCATDTRGGDHGRRKSIFGWQEMHASLSSPVLNVARPDDQATTSEQPESSVSSFGTGEPSDHSNMVRSPLMEKASDDEFRAEQVDNFRNQEPGQIMNGAVFDDLRAESFREGSARMAKAHCLSSEEKKEETRNTPCNKAPEKDNLQSKLENLFESHWSGWPVLEAAKSASPSQEREDSGLSGTPESQRSSDCAEKLLDVNCGSSRHTVSPSSDADVSNDSRNPLAVNRALLNTASDGPRLSITPPLKKERGLLAFARSAVSRLTSAASGGSSPRSDNSSSIDREGLGSGSFRKSRRHKSHTTSKPMDLLEGNANAESVSPFSEERIRSLEAAVEEAILMKRGGAVQHSPPNKTQPPPNPWSPVKKGQHPGPFDCTKKTAVNTLVL